MVFGKCFESALGKCLGSGAPGLKRDAFEKCLESALGIALDLMRRGSAWKVFGKHMDWGIGMPGKCLKSVWEVHFGLLEIVRGKHLRFAVGCAGKVFGKCLEGGLGECLSECAD